MKPYITAKEVLDAQGEGLRGYKLLTADNGCMSGCCSGITIYSDTSYSSRPGIHDDQEGFYVLEGKGMAKLDDFEFNIAPGDSFIALPGVAHTIKSDSVDTPVKVFWFHSAI